MQILEDGGWVYVAVVVVEWRSVAIVSREEKSRDLMIIIFAMVSQVR